MYTNSGFLKTIWALALVWVVTFPVAAQTFPAKLVEPLAPLAVMDSLDATGLQQWGYVLATRTYALLAFEQEILVRRQQQIDSMTLAIETAKTDTTVDKKTVRTMSKDLKNLQSAEKAAAAQVESAAALLERCSAYNSSDSAGQATALPAMWAGVNGAENAARLRAGLTPSPGDMPADSAATSPPTVSPTAYVAYKPEADPMLYPPVPPCRWAVDERDAFSGEVRKETEREVLFRYTNPKLQALYPDRPHTVGEATLGRTGDVLRFDLILTISDPNARNVFGKLALNSPALFKLLDGTTLTLNNLKGDEGTALPDNAGYVYRAQYMLDKTAVKQVKKSGLDKVRLTWATGYEDYDIQLVDFLQRALRCIE